MHRLNAERGGEEKEEREKGKRETVERGGEQEERDR